MSALAFAQGRLGHQFSRPLSADDEPDLLFLFERHGGMRFEDDAGQILGAWLCDCPECEGEIILFCRSREVSLIAQIRGERHFRFENGQVKIERATYTVGEQRWRDEAISIATQVAMQVAEKVGLDIAKRTAAKVAKQVAAEMLRGGLQARQQRASRMNELIAMSERQQAEMLKD